MSKAAVGSGLSVEQLRLHCAIERLRSIGRALSWVLIVVCWCVLCCFFVLRPNVVDLGVMLLFASAVSACLFAWVDVLVRLEHCSALSVALPPIFQQHAQGQPFKPLPSHFVDKGAESADSAVEAWLNSLAGDSSDIRAFACRQRQIHGFLRNTDAVNLRLYANLRLRQRKAGWLAC